MNFDTFAARTVGAIAPEIARARDKHLSRHYAGVVPVYGTIVLRSEDVAPVTMRIGFARDGAVHLPPTGFAKSVTPPGRPVLPPEARPFVDMDLVYRRRPIHVERGKAPRLPLCEWEFYCLPLVQAKELYERQQFWLVAVSEQDLMVAPKFRRINSASFDFDLDHADIRLVCGHHDSIEYQTASGIKLFDTRRRMMPGMVPGRREPLRLHALRAYAQSLRGVWFKETVVEEVADLLAFVSDSAVLIAAKGTFSRAESERFTRAANLIERDNHTPARIMLGGGHKTPRAFPLTIRKRIELEDVLSPADPLQLEMRRVIIVDAD